MANDGLLVGVILDAIAAAAGITLWLQSLARQWARQSFPSFTTTTTVSGSPTLLSPQSAPAWFWPAVVITVGVAAVAVGYFVWTLLKGRFQ